MKQDKIVRAYNALFKLCAQNTSIRTAKKLFDMKRKFQPVIEFQQAEEKKIYDAHPNLDPVNMRLKPPEDQNDISMAAFEKEKKEIERVFQELGDTEQELEIAPFTMNAEAERIRLSANDIEDLEGFIEFE